MFAALIARDLEPLALTCLSSSATEVGPSRIAAWLTPFWMSQITFPVILLFAFRKCERSAALRTRDFEVWHRGFSTRGESRSSTLFALRSAGVAFLSTHEVMVRKRCFSNTTPKSYASRRLSCRECTPANECIQTFCVAESRQEIPDVWRVRNSAFAVCEIYWACSPAHCLHRYGPQHGSPDIRAPDF